MKTVDLNNLIEKTKKLCEIAGINEFSAFRFLYENVLQIYILSQVPNPNYLRCNLQLKTKMSKIFSIDPELQKWWKIIDQSINPINRYENEISTDKWKVEVFLKNPIQHCYYCKKTLTIKDCEVDHIVPRDLGGFDQASNYVLSCSPCNNGKRNSPSTFRFNIFNFQSCFRFLFRENKNYLKKNERFQILQWAEFRCEECDSFSKPLDIYYKNDPLAGGQALLGTSLCLCADCCVDAKKMEDY